MPARSCFSIHWSRLVIRLPHAALVPEDDLIAHPFRVTWYFIFRMRGESEDEDVRTSWWDFNTRWVGRAKKMVFDFSQDSYMEWVDWNKITPYSWLSYENDILLLIHYFFKESFYIFSTCVMFHRYTNYLGIFLDLSNTSLQALYSKMQFLF